MNRRADDSHEPAARSLPLTSRAEEKLNRNAARRIGEILEDRRLVTEEGCIRLARLAHALDDLANSQFGKVSALRALGSEARRVLQRRNLPPNSPR